jgi:hypothetical protein
MQEILFVVEEAEDGSYRASAAAAAIHTEATTGFRRYATPDPPPSRETRTTGLETPPR